MILLMQGDYCPPPPPPGFKPNSYVINKTLQHGVDTGSAGGDLGSLGKMDDWDSCARAANFNINANFCLSFLLKMQR